ncbi:hypothetical protein LUZ60_007930 [Juncus effusus]|nr:hypothetical protein LUZ60_007930 [Juncus effusus]
MFSAMEMEGEGEGEASSELVSGFPIWIAARRKLKSDDPFFAAGNLERELLAKQVALDLTEDERNQLQKMDISSHKFFCPIVGCGAKLDSLDDFESHYNTRHSASCSVCFRVYPTDRLLSIHISETHDSFFQAKVSRGFPMYECLVEGCTVKLKSSKSRHQHLIDKHKFPSSFQFNKTARFSKHQRQKRHAKARKDPPPQKEKMEIDHTEGRKEGMEIDEIVEGVSRLNVDLESDLPKNVSFGRGSGRGFMFVPRSVKNQNQVSKQ